MRVVFLDIDGVLINYESLKHGAPYPLCVSRLNRLVDQSGASIVVSSLWRLAENPDISEKLREWGVTGKVIGVTPDFRRVCGEILIAKERGMEIEAWLTMNASAPISFVILDDDKDMGDLLPYLVRTNYETGLTDADVDQALRILTEGP